MLGFLEYLIVDKGFQKEAELKNLLQISSSGYQDMSLLIFFQFYFVNENIWTSMHPFPQRILNMKNFDEKHNTRCFMRYVKDQTSSIVCQQIFDTTIDDMNVPLTRSQAPFFSQTPRHQVNINVELPEATRKKISDILSWYQGADDEIDDDDISNVGHSALMKAIQVFSPITSAQEI